METDHITFIDSDAPEMEAAEVEEQQEGTTEENTGEVGEKTEEQPEVKEEVTEERKEEPVVPAAPAAPAPQPTPAEAPVQPQQQPKRIEQAEALEALGLKDDPYFEKMLAAYKSGDLTNFNRLNGTDWDKVSDMDVIRHQLEDKYKTLDPKKRDFMIKRDMGQYEIGESFDEDERMAAEISAELRAKEIRDGYKAAQTQYKAPGPQEPAEFTQYKQAMQQAEQEVDALITSLKPGIQQFETNRLITLGEGEDAFNYEVPTEVDIAKTLREGYQEVFLTPGKDGKSEFNLARWIKTAAIARDPDKWANLLIEHGRTQERAKKDAALRNLNNSVEEAAPPKGGEVKWIG